MLASKSKVIQRHICNRNEQTQGEMDLDADYLLLKVSICLNVCFNYRSVSWSRLSAGM